MVTEASFLTEFKSFDIENAILSFWTFKSTKMGSDSPNFSGRWASIDENLSQHLKSIVKSSLLDITEEKEYTLLSQTDDNIALSIGADDTFCDLILKKAEDESDQNKPLVWINDSRNLIMASDQ